MRGSSLNQRQGGSPSSRCRQLSRNCAVSIRSASSLPMTQNRIVDGLESVLHSKQYSAVLLDQFGVLHDGKAPYPKAIAAVRRLHEAGLTIHVISNSSRRSTGTIAKLEAMGFSGEWFSGAVTSGELAYLHLQSRPTEWWRTLGRRVLHLTWGARGNISLDGLNLEIVDWPEEAEFILAHGSEAVGSAWGRPVREMSLPKINQLLVRCAAQQQVRKRPIPMVVANPDLVTVDGDKLIVMPGTLAQTYQELGGVVQLMGKPDPVIYENSLRHLGMKDHPEQVLAIGDSLQHDVFGAQSMGIDSLFIAGGIHAAELLNGSGTKEINLEGLQQLCEQHKATPTYTTASLQW